MQIGIGVELYGVSYLFDRSMSSTAFVYTREGFVISADGRCTLLDGTIDSDNEVKIFDLQAGPLTAAYAITGHIGSAFHDLTVEAKRLGSVFATRRISGGYECAEALARGLKRYLGECLRDRLIDGKWMNLCATNDGFARLVMAGYFDQEPFFCTINFALSQSGKILIRPSSHPVRPGTAVAEGSDKIQSLIRRGDSRFRIKAEILGRVPEETTEEGSRWTRYLIESMCDEQAMDIDPERCRRIGGHIHTASVTPGGFFWIVPPITELGGT